MNVDIADNLNYAKREMLLPDLSALDAVDGLDCFDNVLPPNDACDSANSLHEEGMSADCETGDGIAYVARTDPPNTDGGSASSTHIRTPQGERGVVDPIDGQSTNSFIATGHKYHSLSSIHSQGSVQTPSNGKSSNDGWMRARRRSTQAQASAAVRALDDDKDDSDVDCDDLYDDEADGGVGESSKSMELKQESSRPPEGAGGHGSRARSHTVESTLERGMTNLADRTSNLVAEMGNRATDLVVGVAAVTPGLNKIVNPFVHRFLLFLFSFPPRIPWHIL